MSTNFHRKTARLICRRPGVWGQLPHPAGHKFAIGISSGYPDRNLVPVCLRFYPILMQLSASASAPQYFFPKNRYPRTLDAPSFVLGDSHISPKGTFAMTYLHPVAAVPNHLITDAALSYTAKRVAFVLLLLAGRKGRYVTASFAALAQLCKCSRTTVQKVVKELCAQGYLHKSNRYHFDEQQNRFIYASNRYLWLRREGGYTLVSREILAYDLTPAAFVTLLYLYRCAGRKGRAFPSLRRIAKAGLDMAKSTVCLALKTLRLLQAVVRYNCVTRRRCHASSSYYLTNFVFSRNQIPSSGGGPKNDKPISINQLTRDNTLRKTTEGAVRVGSFSAAWSTFWSSSAFYFDGVGVRVYAYTEETVLTA